MGAITLMNDGLSVGDSASSAAYAMSQAQSSSTPKTGKYTIGTFLGEEWIFFKNYRHREETCVATEPSCVLEITVESFEAIR